MAKSPYRFPLKKKSAILDFLSGHDSYHPMNSWNGGFVLSWNIKVYHFDRMGKGFDDFPVLDRFDDQWLEHLDGEGSDLFSLCCSDAISFYTDGLWTVYPGIEQGEWKFGINGRNGGHLMLTHTPAWLPAPRDWKCFPMTWESRGRYENWLAQLDWQDLLRFYKVVCMLDHDLRDAAKTQEINYQLAQKRHDWEQERLAEEQEDVEAQLQARPDLYPIGA